MSTDNLRKQFMQEGLRREALDADPVKQFEQWFMTSMELQLAEPSAMSLATVDAQGQPWQRMVLLKLYDTRGFVFFTNYASRKATQIAANPNVSLLFPWHALGRQVKITGRAEKIATTESFEYFTSRPRGSQIGAWASPQSRVIKSRAVLDTLFNEMKQRFASGQIPLPGHWGGYRVVPDSLEFWQARESRLHDRFIYRRDNSGWLIERLAP